MGSYGRNFDTVVPPDGPSRNGQWVTPLVGSRLRIGAPIELDKTKALNALGFKSCKLSTSASTVPLSGNKGILVYEEIIMRGVDPAITTYSDPTIMTTAPLGAAVQMISGREVYVVFRNTAAQTFLGAGSIPAVTMVAGFGATPTVALGDYLAPGTGNDTDGYWAEVSALADAWLVVEDLNHDRGEITCRMLV